MRRLQGENGRGLRRYVLGLSLVAATGPMDGFLRAGCLLTLDPEDKATWHSLARSGERIPVDLNEKVAFDYARRAASHFGLGKSHRVAFDKKLAVADTKTKAS